MRRSPHTNACRECHTAYVNDSHVAAPCPRKAQIKIRDGRFDTPMEGCAYNVKSDRPRSAGAKNTPVAYSTRHN